MTLAGDFKHPPTPPAILGAFVPLRDPSTMSHETARELQLAAPLLTRDQATALEAAA